MNRNQHIADSFNENVFGINVIRRKRGGDHRPKEKIQHYAVIDADTGDVIDDDCNSMRTLALAFGYADSTSRCSRTLNMIREGIEKGLFVYKDKRYKIIPL